MKCVVLIAVILCFVLAVSAKRSKRSFIEEIVELADSERAGPAIVPRNPPARLPFFANQRNNFAPRSFGSIGRNSRLPFFANQRNPSFVPSARSFGSKPLGYGRAALRNYANRFNGKSPFGSLPRAQPRNQPSRLPFFANPRNIPAPGRSFGSIGRNGRLPFFANQRNPSFIPTRSFGNNRGINPTPRNIRNTPQPTNPSEGRRAKQMPELKTLGGKAKRNTGNFLDRALDRFLETKQGKALKSLYESVRDPVDKLTNFGGKTDLSKFNINRKFLEKVEGSKLEGYVPKAGHSGVTIGTGFDIGQRKGKGELAALGLPKHLVEKLAPYTNMDKSKASAYLKQNPLTITKEEARAIDTAVMYAGANKLARDYDSAAARHPGSIKRFTDLPRSVQTVAYSVEHQYGSLKSATPKFFDQLARNDYNGMIGNLRNFKDAYSSRRNKEADYMTRYVK